MKFNCNKSCRLVFNRSRSSNPPHSNIIIGDSKIETCFLLKLLDVFLDPVLTFEPHLCSIAASFSQKVGLLRKCWEIYSNDILVRINFYSFLWPLLHYYSPIYHRTFFISWCCTDQFPRCFIPALTNLWNTLSNNSFKRC